MTALDILIIVCLALGGFFALTGALGIVRLPDYFTRMHAAGVTDTMGVILILAALLGETVKYAYGYTVGAKIVLIGLFILITAPVATHAIAKAAALSGLRPSPDAADASKGAVDE